jgi:hypothetical protein
MRGKMKMDDDIFPFHCQQCGASGQLILSCPKRKVGDCPYQFREHGGENISLVGFAIWAGILLAFSVLINSPIFTIISVGVPLAFYILSRWLSIHSILINCQTGERWDRKLVLGIIETSAQVFLNPQSLPLASTSQELPLLSYSAIVLDKSQSVWQREISRAVSAVQFALIGLAIHGTIHILVAETYTSRFGGRLKYNGKHSAILISLVQSSQEPIGGWLEKNIIVVLRRAGYPLTVYEVVHDIYDSAVIDAPHWLVQRIDHDPHPRQSVILAGFVDARDLASAAIDSLINQNVILSKPLRWQIKKAIESRNIRERGDSNGGE